MANDIRISHNRYEDAAVLELEDGSRLEAVVVHLPGSQPTFVFAHMTAQQLEDGEYTEIFTCPVDAA